MNLGTLMICATTIWLIMYWVQVKGTPATSKRSAEASEARADNKGSSLGGGSKATQPGGWFSAFSDFGAGALFVSTILFCLTLGVPLDWLNPVFQLFGAAAATADLLTRMLLWIFIVVVGSSLLKRQFAVEPIEAIVGPAAALAVYKAYEAGTPVIKHLVDLVARAFGLGV